MKDIKRINTLFLFVVIVAIAASTFASLLATKSIKIPIMLNLIISQCLILLPALIFLLLFYKSSLKNIIGDKISVGSFFLIIVLTELCMPLATTANLFSQLFTKNEMVGISGEVTEIPFLSVFLMMGIIGPMSEEFVFRGVIFRGLRKHSGRFLASMFLSALFFGLMHLNLNQFCYAIVLGCVFAIVDEALGSLIPSIIMHCVINTQNVALLYVADFAMKITGQSLSSAYDSSVSKNLIVVMTIISFSCAMIMTVLAGLLLFGICNIEKKSDNFRNLFKKTETENDAVRLKVLTFSGIVAIAISGFVIFALEPILKILNK